MSNASDALGALLQAGLRGPSMGRMGHAVGERGLGAPGGGRSARSWASSAVPPGVVDPPMTAAPVPGDGYGQGAGSGIGDILGGLAFLQQEMERPADPDGLAAEAGSDPVVAARVYAA
jgi:hypothetical protein